MKLLFDANISRRIVPMLDDLFPGSSQVLLIGPPGETPDELIWDVAKNENYVIVTADTDFDRLSTQLGPPPPKVIRLERMDYSTAVAAALIRRYAIRIAEFETSQKAILLLRNAAKNKS